MSHEERLQELAQQKRAIEQAARDAREAALAEAAADQAGLRSEQQRQLEETLRRLADMEAEVAALTSQGGGPMVLGEHVCGGWAVGDEPSPDERGKKG